MANYDYFGGLHQDRPPNAQSNQKRFFPRKRVGILLLILVVLGIAAFAIYKWTPFFHTSANKEHKFVTPQAFTQKLVLSLDAPIKDKEGIPYSGTVLYDPTTEKYSYIATEDKGHVTPLGLSAFSSGSDYLALRAGDSSTDFVVYDRSMLAPVRTVKQVSSGSTVSSIAWSNDGKQFAYVSNEPAAAPQLVVENVDASIPAKKLKPSLPIGFSPDGTKILAQSTPMLSAINLADGSVSQMSGAAFANPDTKFMLSPGGNYLITLSEKQIDLYSVSWDNGTLQLMGQIPLKDSLADAVFSGENELLIRENGSDIMYGYGIQNGQVIFNDTKTLALPENAHILHVLSQ